MFEQIKDWLNSLSPQQKAEMIDNLRSFQKLKTLLEAKKVIITGKDRGELLIVKDHIFANAFLRLSKKIGMRGVTVIDKREKKIVTGGVGVQGKFKS